MKSRFYILVIFLVLSMFGCSKGLQHQAKHFKSSIVGLKRKVTHISPTGSMRVWEGKFNIEVDGAFVRFITDDGKAVYISGSIIVEEIK